MWTNVQSSRGLTPFGLAIARGHLEVVWTFLQFGVKSSDSKLLSKMLKCACREGKIDFVELLLQEGIETKQDFLF